MAIEIKLNNAERIRRLKAAEPDISEAQIIERLGVTPGQIKAALRYGQRQAVAQRRNVYVVVSAANVRLCYDAGCAAPVSDFGSGAPFTTKSAPSGVALVPQTFSFDAMGQPSAGAPFTIDGVVVEADTGYVR